MKEKMYLDEAYRGIGGELEAMGYEVVYVKDDTPGSRALKTLKGLRYLSLFSGIEACSVAWDPLGWTPVAFAQYEPGDKVQYPSQVLAYHYPNVPNLGDVTKITEEQIAALGHIDILVGGSPCQDLSVAGRRTGLRDENGNITRSGLFDYQMQIFEWAREHCQCRWMLWENVPGSLSSGKKVKGSDFAYILGSMVGRDIEVPAGGWKNSGIVLSGDGSRITEYRILDAQHFGVAQRRRRVFALADVGPWWSRQPVLFESEGRSRDPQALEGAQQGPSTTPSEDTGGDGEPGPSSGAGGRGLDAVGKAIALQTGHTKGLGSGVNEDDVSYTLSRANDHAVAYKDEDPCCIGWNARDIRGAKVTEDSIDPLGATQYKAPPIVGYKAECITAGNFGGYGDDVSPTLMQRDYKDPNLVGYPEPVAYKLDSVASNSMKSSNPNSGVHEEDVCCTLDTSDQNPAKNQGGMAIVDKVSILNFQGSKGNSVAEESDVMYTLNAMHGHDAHCVVDTVAMAAMAVDVRNSRLDDKFGALQAAAAHNLNSNNVCIVEDTGVAIPIDRRNECRENSRNTGVGEDGDPIGTITTPTGGGNIPVVFTEGDDDDWCR